MPEIIKGDDNQIGSSNWFKFLEMSTTESFRYEGIAGSFTARKRSNGAWNAYRKLFGKLRQEYLGLSKALDHDRLEAIAAKLALSDIEYWSTRTKVQKKDLTATLESRGYTSQCITELKAQLQEANQKAAGYEQKITTAIALLKDALPLPANKGGAIKEKIKQALALLDRT